MKLDGKKVGFALTGSFCTLESVIPYINALTKEGAEVFPIMSEIVYNTDTRFGKAEDFISQVEQFSQKNIIKSIKEAEPIGPKKMFDAMVIAPCTGNTLAKMAWGVTDSSVTMAAKSHLRNKRPLVIAVSTNDGLGAAGKNIGMLQNYKNIYFVPYHQDDPVNKANSLVADFDKIIVTLENALSGTQIQPILF